MKNRLKRTVCRKDRKISGIYWLIYEPNEAPLIRLINTAGDYSTDTFKDLIDNFNYGQLEVERKLAMEQEIWETLDKLKDSDSDEYKNLLTLDNKLFASLQPNEILH